MKKRAIFTDWNGVVAIYPKCNHPGKDSLIMEVFEAFRLIGLTTLSLFVISNKAGVAKGLYTVKDVQDSFCTFNRHLLSQGIRPVDEFYFCPHHPEGTVSGYSRECDCRKPFPGLFHRAAEEHQIDLANSWYIGDQLKDIKAGTDAKVKKTILVRTGSGKLYEKEALGMGVPVVDHILAAVSLILKEEPGIFLPGSLRPSSSRYDVIDWSQIFAT